jgi:hypothetical protein
MCNRFLTALLILCLFSLNVSAKNSDDPFAKYQMLDVGLDVRWDIDKKAVLATKSVSDDSGAYYHLKFNNKQLEFIVSSDADGLSPKSFNNLEVKAFKIDGKQAPLFAWCLNNQQRHNRFLQQGLSVKKNICEIKGEAGRFVINLNRDTLMALQKGHQLTVVIKPFRTPIKLNYDISDFEEMTLALNAKSKPVAKSATAVNPAMGASTQGVAVSAAEKCWAKPPEKYKTIKAIEYSCADATAKLDAETGINNQVNQKIADDRALAAQRSAEIEKQRKQAEEIARQEQVAQAELDAAIAASAAKQAQIGDDISNKMVAMCDKYWKKGEHRCYCQKYIEYAPDEIQKNSSCE